MYEASFGLKRRPFAATPDATCFLSAGPIQAAFDELVVCVEQGQGIAVLTSPAGTGKTLLCERLRSELNNRFETVFLRHASFLTRRALLQTVLCELNHAYHHPSEQELRLELLPAIRALQPKREALVLICDEAHQLTDSLIEELRILADFAESGRPLVRLVLVGQLSLEEKLAQNSLEAFNQRIRAHVNLPTFDRTCSLDYIDYRLTWAGGRTDEIFTSEALDLIVRASDGIPRCINQLADHTLLLAFVAEQRPAGEELVREALNDLRQLPLHWNEPSPTRAATDKLELNVNDDDSRHMSVPSNDDSSGFLMESTPRGAAYSYESDDDWPKSVSMEIGAEASLSALVPSVELETMSSTDQISGEIGSDEWRHTVDLFSPRSVEIELDSTPAQRVSEPAGIASAEGTSSLSAPRGRLHDLVQDAYAAAAGPDLRAWRPQQSSSDETIQTGNTVESSRNSFSQGHVEEGNWNRTSAIDISSQMSYAQTTNGFQEEVIIDRYATIDAGLTLDAIAHPDTTNVNEVRVEPVEEANSDRRQPPDRANAIRFDRDDFSDLDSNIEPIRKHRFKEVADTNETLDNVLDVVHHLIEVVSEQNDSSESQPSDQIGCPPITLPGETQIDEFSRKITEQRSVLWNRLEANQNDPSNFEIGASNSGDADRDADGIDLSSQSTWPTENLGSDGDSILKTFRGDVEELVNVVEPGSVCRLSEEANSSNWEAIETAPVESTVKPRPFRYLFSMLRRKQQQMM